MSILSLISTIFGAYKIGGVALSEIIAWFKTPEGEAAVGAAKTVISGLVQNGDSLRSAGLKLLAMVGKIHKMTPAEEKIWMERGTLPPDSFHDFPQ